MGLAFVPELRSLRDNRTHVHRVNVVPNTSAPTVFNGRHIEIQLQFAVNSSHPHGLALLAPHSQPTPPPPPAANCSNPFVPCVGWDRAGADLGCTSPPGTVEQCEARCLALETCLAWTWCGEGSAGPQPRCCLKSKVPDKVEPFEHMVCGIAPRAKGHIPPGAMDFSHPSVAPPGGTGVVYDPATHSLSVSTHSNPGHDRTPLSLRDGEGLSLHIYVDGNLIEVVANGRASLATSVAHPPTSDDAVKVLGGVRVANFSAWSLNGIWGD
eukprot:COSAG01_NODE_2442_length_7689_cov_89.459289_4_plen_268_part_00